MFEESQMVRRVKAYLSKMKVITDEDELHRLSLLCEAAPSSNSVTSGSAISFSSTGSSQMKKRHPSPTLSTASSTSSTSGEGRKMAVAPKFGSESPQAVRKLLSLSEKTRPYQPRHPSPSAGSHHHHHHHHHTQQHRHHLSGIRLRNAPSLNTTSHERSILNWSRQSQ